MITSKIVLTERELYLIEVALERLKESIPENNRYHDQARKIEFYNLIEKIKTFS